MKKFIILIIIGSSLNLFSQEKTIYWENGKQKSIINYTDDKKNGACSYFSEDGYLKEQGQYVNDEKEGEWKEYKFKKNYHKLYLVGEGSYKNSKKTGLWKYHYFKRITTGMYVDGKKEGYWKSYVPHDDGSEPRIYSEENYINGQKDGKCIYYNIAIYSKIIKFYDKGKKIGKWQYFEFPRKYLKINKIENYKNNKRNGYTIDYYYEEDKKYIAYKTWYKDDIIIGDVLQFNAKGQIIEKTPYKKGKKEGIYKEFRYEDDTQYISYTGKYIDGKKEGKWKHFNKNGTVERIAFYKNGKKEGVWKEYYDNGAIESEEEYANDKKDGEWTKYYKNGSLRSKEIYSNNEEIGNWISYYRSGNIENTIDHNTHLHKYFYKNGQLFNSKYYLKNYKDFGEEKVYYRNGNLKSIKKYDTINKRVYIKEYDKNKQLALEKTTLLNGQKNGLWLKYYKNGNLQEKRNYKYDDKNGLWEFYYKNGDLKQKGNYTDGKKTGVWELYYKNNIIYSTLNQDTGNNKIYDKEGRLKLFKNETHNDFWKRELNLEDIECLVKIENSEYNYILGIESIKEDDYYDAEYIDTFVVFLLKDGNVLSKIYYKGSYFTNTKVLTFELLDSFNINKKYFPLMIQLESTVEYNGHNTSELLFFRNGEKLIKGTKASCFERYDNSFKESHFITPKKHKKNQIWVQTTEGAFNKSNSKQERINFIEKIDKFVLKDDKFELLNPTDHHTFVANKKGTIIYEEPYIQSDSITTIDYGQYIKVLHKTGMPYSLQQNNKTQTGYWLKIVDFQGYIKDCDITQNQIIIDKALEKTANLFLSKLRKKKPLNSLMAENWLYTYLSIDPNRTAFTQYKQLPKESIDGLLSSDSDNQEPYMRSIGWRRIGWYVHGNTNLKYKDAYLDFYNPEEKSFYIINNVADFIKIYFKMINGEYKVIQLEYGPVFRG